jgi:hypothetical protein
MIPEPIVSVADLLSDDRRDARVALLGDLGLLALMMLLPTIKR